MSMPRIHWGELPAAVRRAVEARTGPVLAAHTASGGVNSAIAATLHTPAGRVFCKGMPAGHRQVWTQRQETLINPHVLHIAPRLLWQIETDGWNLLGFAHVDGRHPDLTPGSPDLPKVADLIHRLAATACPDLPVKTAGRRWAAYTDPAGLHHLRGDRLLHTDLAPHNMLLDGRDGRVVLIDWAWAARGPAWLDIAVLLLRLIDAGHTPPPRTGGHASSPPGPAPRRGPRHLRRGQPPALAGDRRRRPRALEKDHGHSRQKVAGPPQCACGSRTPAGSSPHRRRSDRPPVAARLQQRTC